MNKRIVLIINYFCLLFLLILIGCNTGKAPKECITFEEMGDPTSDTLSDWSKVTTGLQASLVSVDVKYPRSVAPEISINKSVTLTGWKAEKLSGQLLLWTAEDIKQVECEFTDFTSSSGKLPANIAEARFVRYVMTDIFEPGCGYRKPEDFPASLVPDMLDNLACFDIPEKTVRPVWLTVNVPESAVAGTYKSKLTITARDQKTQEFEVELKVQDRILPPPFEWQYHLDLWQHPAAVARAQNLELWSDAHFEAMKPLYKMLADAGQKVITATLNKDPWVQTYDKYEDMILWTKNADGTWVYDYTVFDRWIQFMMDLGVTKMINCYSVIPWKSGIHYKDAASGEMIDVEVIPGTKVFEEIWTPFFADFKKHLENKGWLTITNVAMDERGPKEMKAAMDVLHKIAPDFGISLADNHKSYKQYPYIKDMSVAADAKVDSADIQFRKEKGLITTYYVCCSDKFPNMFTCSQLPEAVYAGWYCMAAGYDGMLRWAYNSWVENPLTDSRFVTWPAGDTYIVYPEARSSMRFERLVEGIQDAEKIRILRNEFKDNPEKLKTLDDEVAKFNTITPGDSYVDMINRAKNVLNKLSE
ncbi:hypothetical protein GGR21_000813 [Dysgonomonas hofstadii]|uniref:Glycoside hydrolase 123 C-terminal domain-containing protein n=1 Tax=Dysgonomonas hofstadii TaxID=637886 RepID=A0A840CI02_9BACT|nr:glycoside hydrolase domain-containing protein [Dysgonomonas hofstadii]MBB4034926.1 hypothetical protein [Dysgonomonas hofstadii]